MHQFSYSPALELDQFQICESADFQHYDCQDGLQEWTEAELSGIRKALRKLTALRVDNPADAEDLVQETLLTLLRKRPKTIEKGLMTWAMGILRRKVGNYYRRTRRCLVQEAQIRYLAEGIRLAPSPESLLHHAELMSMVDGVLVHLSPQERAPVDLFLAGRQTGEIVSLLHPERYQNIVNRLHRARKKLARELARHGYMRGASAGRLKKPTNA